MVYVALLLTYHPLTFKMNLALGEMGCVGVKAIEL